VRRRSLAAWPRGWGRVLLGCTAALGLLASCGEEAPEADPAVGSRAESEARDLEIARGYFSDAPLVTQDGESVRLFSDVLQDRVVVIHGFCTRCEGHTPRQLQVLLQLQAMLGESLGRDAFIVSVTVDPKTDTPEVVREFVEEQGAGGPGWTFLTGEVADVDAVNAKLGQRVEDPEDFQGLYMLGNVRTTLWLKLPAHAMPMDLFRHVQRLIQDPGEAAEG
jgi:protein SCO1/2